MKTRTALIYLAVLVVLAGYFYYFEVVRRNARTEEKEAALRLFQVEKGKITSLQLDKGEGKPITLNKQDQWQIIEPIDSPADEFAVGNLLTILESLKIEREVAAEAQDLKVYGLDNPRLHLSFLADGTRHHLRIGSKAVVANQYYGSGDQQNRVVLIAANQEKGLNKSLFDLRRKEFFSLKSDEIDRIEIGRAEEILALTRVTKDRWQAPAFPEVSIKNSKVDSLISRLIWLRAKKFLDNEKTDLPRLGLDPARIRITLVARDKTNTLLLGNSKKAEGIYASGGQLPGVALVDEKLLEQLPDSLSDLEDRTLLAFDLDQVKGVELKLNADGDRLERQGEKWKWEAGNSRQLPENWQVNALLWKIQELEYLPGSLPQEDAATGETQLNLVLYSEKDEKLGTFFLAELPSEKTEKGLLWFFKDNDKAQPYWMSGETLRELVEKTRKLLNPES
ncbi:MAG: DUF4340 domain-containing protein [Deltaproteobacteria bacterium]|nr:DUF4340 domain-containing protein [Deltaproteobacteria bacterium]